MYEHLGYSAGTFLLLKYQENSSNRMNQALLQLNGLYVQYLME